MSWIVEDRRNKRHAADQPLVTDDMRRHVTDVLMPRYPTKRACLLPALHLVQHEYGWIPPEALAEVAAPFFVGVFRISCTCPFLMKSARFGRAFSAIL